MGNVYHRYLGLRFNIQRQIHYGWAQFDVHIIDNETLAATLFGYAYETIPGRGLRAGQTGGSYSPVSTSGSFEPTLHLVARGSSGLGQMRRWTLTELAAGRAY